MNIEQARSEAQGALNRTRGANNGRDWDAAVAVINRVVLETVLARLDTLEAKVRSGAEAARDMEKHYDENHFDADNEFYAAGKADGAEFILDAMEEPNYAKVKHGI